MILRDKIRGPLRTQVSGGRHRFGPTWVPGALIIHSFPFGASPLLFEPVWAVNGLDHGGDGRKVPVGAQRDFKAVAGQTPGSQDQLTDLWVNLGDGP